VLVLNPGAEICAPDCVATALLWTSQPLLPKLEMSLASVPSGKLGLTAAVWAIAGNAAAERAAAGMPFALDSRQAKVTADTTAAAPRAE
jgi:hypothetical protein